MMPKTDKELTAEIVCTFIQSWNAKGNTAALMPKDLPDIIQTVYDAIHSLDKEEQSET